MEKRGDADPFGSFGSVRDGGLTLNDGNERGAVEAANETNWRAVA